MTVESRHVTSPRFASGKTKRPAKQTGTAFNFFLEILPKGVGERELNVPMFHFAVKIDFYYLDIPTSATPNFKTHWGAGATMGVLSNGRIPTLHFDLQEKTKKRRIQRKKYIKMPKLKNLRHIYTKGRTRMVKSAPL